VVQLKESGRDKPKRSQTSNGNFGKRRLDSARGFQFRRATATADSDIRSKLVTEVLTKKAIEISDARYCTGRASTSLT